MIEAVESGTHPERLTSAVKPKPFDRTEYAVHPQAYLDICEPGRIWDVADVGLGVPEIALSGAGEIDMKPGGSAKLEVKAVPLSPVTFTSFDWGAFDNGLTSITLRSDSKGMARATFTATPGTVGKVDIVAASPLTSGQVKFHVEIR